MGVTPTGKASVSSTAFNSEDFPALTRPNTAISKLLSSARSRIAAIEGLNSTRPRARIVAGTIETFQPGFQIFSDTFREITVKAIDESAQFADDSVQLGRNTFRYFAVATHVFRFELLSGDIDRAEMDVNRSGRGDRRLSSGDSLAFQNPHQL